MKLLKHIVIPNQELIQAERIKPFSMLKVIKEKQNQSVDKFLTYFR